MRELIVYERGDGIDEKYLDKIEFAPAKPRMTWAFNSSLIKHLKGHCETEETLQNNDEI